MTWFADPREKEEDRQLFARSEASLGEEEMTLFLSLLREEKAYQGGLRRRVVDYLRFLENGGQGYRDRRIKDKAVELTAALGELKIHTGAHFLMFPRNQTGPDCRYFLHPDYFVLEMTNVSIEEHRFYIKAEMELTRMVDRTDAAYQQFRALARKRLEK